MNKALLKSIVTTIALYTSTTTLAQDTYSRLSYDISHGLTQFNEKIRISEPDRFTTLNPSMDQKDFIRKAKFSSFNSHTSITISYRINKRLSFLIRPETGVWGTISLIENTYFAAHNRSLEIQKSIPTKYWAIPLGLNFSTPIERNFIVNVGIITYYTQLMIKNEYAEVESNIFNTDRNYTSDLANQGKLYSFYLKPRKTYWSFSELEKYSATAHNKDNEKYDPNPRLVCTIPMSIIYRWKSIRFGLHYEYGFSLKYDKVMQVQYPAESSYRLHGYRFSLGWQLKKGSIGRFMKKLDEWTEPPK